MFRNIIFTIILSNNILLASSTTIIFVGGGVEDFLSILDILSRGGASTTAPAAVTQNNSRCQELHDDETIVLPASPTNQLPLPSDAPALPKKKLTRTERTARAIRIATRKELRFRRAAYRRFLREEAETKTLLQKLTPTTAICKFTEFDPQHFQGAISIPRFDKAKLMPPFDPGKFPQFTFTVDPSQFFTNLPTIAKPHRSLSDKSMVLVPAASQPIALCGYASPKVRKEYLEFFNGDKTRAAMQRTYERFLDVAKTGGFSEVAKIFSLTPYTRSNGEMFEIRLNDFYRIMIQRGPNGEVIIMSGVEHHKKNDRK